MADAFSRVCMTSLALCGVAMYAMAIFIYPGDMARFSAEQLAIFHGMAGGLGLAFPALFFSFDLFFRRPALVR